MRKRNKPLVMDNRFFLGSLMLIGIGGLFGVVGLPFGIMGMVLWLYFRK